MAAVDITDRIVGSASYCLNEAADGPYSHLFMGDHSLSLKSDVDPQLIIHLEFQQTMNLTQLSIGLPSDDTCPHTIKLFANVKNLGFGDAPGKSVYQCYCFPTTSIEPLFSSFF